MNIFIIHGSFGHPKENWFPWLKKQLSNLGHKVYVPKFPVENYSEFEKACRRNPSAKLKNQSLKSWMKTFEKYFPILDKNTILIGHSLGPAFILRILERCEKPVRASIFVSGFLEGLVVQYLITTTQHL